MPRPGKGLPPWARVTPARRKHIERVAALVRGWAEAARVGAEETERWLRAAYLHDAMRDAEADLLARLAPDAWGVPALRHGPAAARLAEEQGESDSGVLSAVRYHSVGYAGWDRAGHMLYLADYLDPGRRFRETDRAALAARVPGEPDAALRAVAGERLRWAVESGRPLIRESVDFWNALVVTG